MIFQEFVREVCQGKPAEAARIIEGATGQRLGYARAHRWFRTPSPMSLPYARIVVQGTNGMCTLEELIDADIIGRSFTFADDDAAVERQYVAKRLAARELELRQLLAARKLGRTIETVEREVKQLRMRLGKLDGAEPRRRGRPAPDAAAAAAPSRKRRRKTADAAAA